MVKTCCVTGHREIAPNAVTHVKESLSREVEEALKDGYIHFVSGFAEGVDQWFAEIVLNFKSEFPQLTLEAAIPYRDRIKRLMNDPLTSSLLAQCSGVCVCSQEYAPGCFMVRNRAMVNMSKRVIAVYDGRTGGGTLYTMREARRLERELRVIKV